MAAPQHLIYAESERLQPLRLPLQYSCSLVWQWFSEKEKGEKLICRFSPLAFVHDVKIRFNGSGAPARLPTAAFPGQATPQSARTLDARRASRRVSWAV